MSQGRYNKGMRLLHELRVNRYLLFQLTQREVKARYKQSFLGYIWVVLVPLARLTVLSFVFSYFFRVDTSPIPYAIFLFTALVPWQFTATAIAAAASSVVANSSLVTKINVFRMVFPLSAIGVKLIDASLAGVVLLGMLIFWAHSVNVWWLFVPVVLVIQFLLVTGVSLLVSAINVYYRDVENMLEVLLMIWMYLSPVIYPPEFVPDQFQRLMQLNPLFGIINAYRNTLLYGVPPAWESFSYAAILSLGIFLLGIVVFNRLSKNFADVI